MLTNRKFMIDLRDPFCFPPVFYDPSHKLYVLYSFLLCKNIARLDAQGGGSCVENYIVWKHQKTARVSEATQTKSEHERTYFLSYIQKN